MKERLKVTCTSVYDEQGKLEKKRGSKTIVVITHDLSLMKYADYFAVLCKGTLPYAGTHAEEALPAFHQAG